MKNYKSMIESLLIKRSSFIIIIYESTECGKLINFLKTIKTQYQVYFFFYKCHIMISVMKMKRHGNVHGKESESY